MTVDKDVLQKVEKQFLLEAALSELAALLGHTLCDPLSSELFCLESGLSLAKRDKVVHYLQSLAPTTSEIKLVTLKRSVLKLVPELSNYADPVFNGLLKILIKEFAIELNILGLKS